MNLDDIPSGSLCVIDTNVLLYAEQGVSEQSQRLIRRCARGDLIGILPQTVWQELTHKLMLAEAMTKGLVSGGNPAARLAAKPEAVRSLSLYRAKVQALVDLGPPEGERVENLPVEWLEKAADLWERLAAGDFDRPEDYCIKQMAVDILHANTGGELSASRVDLLPHQILLVHDLVGQSPRRMLIADEVGLGKTIETGMLIRELSARGDASRILIVTPAGLVENWRRELEACFRLHFDILGRDFQDHGSAAWERHDQVIASIDTLIQQRRLQRLLAAAPWDLVIFDEAHHISRTRSGKKTATTQNYRLAEALRNHTRDLLFLSATPHQGNAFQFWSLIQILDDQLFAHPDAIAQHRGLLNRVMIRRTKREVTDATGNAIFRRRQVHTERFSLAPRERLFYEQSAKNERPASSAPSGSLWRRFRRSCPPVRARFARPCDNDCSSCCPANSWNRRPGAAVRKCLPRRQRLPKKSCDFRTRCWRSPKRFWVGHRRRIATRKPTLEGFAAACKSAKSR